MALFNDKNGVFEITKSQARELVRRYHYLKDKDFTFMYAFGLYVDGDCVGAAVFGMVGGTSSLKGWFGIGNSREESSGFLELNRLVMRPDLNGGNNTSKLLGGSIRLLKKKGVRAIVSLADASIHNGYIYQACNFSYHGVTDKKTDFYKYIGDGSFKLNPRGKTKDAQGLWVDRTRKHRYVYLIDKKVNVLYEKLPYPKGVFFPMNCCNGKTTVIDSRFEVEYTCPVCTGEMNIIA